MLPEEYEQLVAEQLNTEGFQAKLTPISGDYGVDIFASKPGVKLAVQVKMYGGSSRKINRAMMMELSGSQKYFDCTGAIMVTDGSVMEDALSVAEKLNIEVRYIPQQEISTTDGENGAFSKIWKKFVMPLEGKTLNRPDGKSNQIIHVDWAGIERLTSNGNNASIDIEIFKWTINRLIKKGVVTRKEINEMYVKRASSGVVLILNQVPFIELGRSRPMRLLLIKNELEAFLSG
jgi:hypothetical protein